jgi:AcrR family transcriptional regulator
VSPRPRKATDDDVFDAAGRVMSRRGPGELTLADIAREAGVTAAALVQRFGSKRELLHALSARAVASVPAMFAALRSAHPSSPLTALRAYADCLAQLGETPGAMAHHLAYLQMDITDDVLHRQTLAQAKASRVGIRALLDDAVRSGELARGTDTQALTRAVEVTLSGSLITWAFYRDGSSTSWLRHDLDAVLAPFRTTTSPRPQRRRSS